MLELVDNPPAVIFATAFDEFAIKAFELNAVDYLLKPFSQERFTKAVQKYLQNNFVSDTKEVVETAAQSELQQNRVVVKDRNKIKIIPVNKIHYVEAADDYVKIITDDGTFLKKRTMSFFENSLSAYHFVRVHRSYIVNSQLITRIDPLEKDSHILLLTTGAKIPISKPGYSRLKEVLGI
jgi:two-component system LytT family response regulator